MKGNQMQMNNDFYSFQETEYTMQVTMQYKIYNTMTNIQYNDRLQTSINSRSNRIQHDCH